MVGVTVLQLDTHFPRIPGDVGCAETFACEIEILRIAGAEVAGIVNDRPDQIDITPFEAALAQAKGEIIVTSCGFLHPWQAHLQAHTQRPFLASSLTALERLDDPEEVTILTYDADRLGGLHLGKHNAFLPRIIGLNPKDHLRAVIRENLAKLDEARAARETVAAVQAQKTQPLKTLVLECTNLPPYKKALRAAFDCQIIDILTEIERIRPNSIRPAHLS